MTNLVGYKTGIALPPVGVILADLRSCGGNVRKFLRKKVPRSDRHEVALRVIAKLQGEAPREFEDLRQAARALALVEAEDNLYSMLKTSKAASVRQVNQALEHIAKAKVDQSVGESMDDIMGDIDGSS